MQSHIQSIEEPNAIQKYKNCRRRKADILIASKSGNSFYRWEQQYQTWSFVNLMTAQKHCMRFYAIEFVYKSKDYKSVTGVAFTMNVKFSQ